MIPGTVSVDSTGKLTFEMRLLLAGELQQADPELSRRTAVAALPDGTDLICLWAGAKTSNWDAGDGVILERSAAAFAPS